MPICYFCSKNDKTALSWTCDDKHSYEICSFCLGMAGKRLYKCERAFTAKPFTIGTNRIALYPPDRSRTKRSGQHQYQNVRNWCLYCLKSKSSGSNGIYLTGHQIESSSLTAANTDTTLTTTTTKVSSNPIDNDVEVQNCDFCDIEMSLNNIDKFTCNESHRYSVCSACNLLLQKQLRKWKKQGLNFSLKPSQYMTPNKTILLSPLFREENNRKNVGQHLISVERWCYVCLQKPQRIGGNQHWMSAVLVKKKLNEKKNMLLSTTTSLNNKKNGKHIKRKCIFGKCNEEYCKYFSILGPGCSVQFNSASQEEEHAHVVKKGGGDLKTLAGYPKNKQAKM